jgi:hypothetical protein
MIRMRNKLCCVMFCGMALAACAPAAKTPPAARPAELAPGAEDALMATDPCATRLQDISAALLMYVTVHKEMPPALEDLRTLMGPDLKLICPTTGQPYVYVRAGLAVPGQERQLVAYEASPGPQGWRWGIVASPPDGSHPLTMLVVRLNQPVLDAYLQSAPAGK